MEYIIIAVAARVQQHLKNLDKAFMQHRISPAEAYRQAGKCLLHYNGVLQATLPRVVQIPKAEIFTSTLNNGSFDIVDSGAELTSEYRHIVKYQASTNPESYLEQYRRFARELKPQRLYYIPILSSDIHPRLVTNTMLDQFLILAFNSIAYDIKTYVKPFLRHTGVQSD